MADDPHRLEDLAEAVLEGRAVDWSSAGSSPDPQSREAVRLMKVVARIAGLYRSLGSETSIPEKLEVWGRLRILERIGQGSFGDVYRAWDTKLDREVALKLLRPDAVPKRGAEVLKEARLLARVRHPNVAIVYDADEIDGRVGLWMEFIHGKNLEEILGNTEKLDEREATRIGIDLCRALTAVHDAGLLHRDIKAQNVMRHEDGRLVLMDFGTGSDLESSSGAVDMAGTPLYLAPEIFEGSPATARSDIYAAGVLLYRLLTGAYPVKGENVGAVADAHKRPAVRSSKLPGVSRSLSAVVASAIDPSPSSRYPSAKEMLSALEAVQRRAKAPRRAALIAAGVAMAVLLVSATAWLSRSDSRLAASSPPAFQKNDWVLITRFENRTGESIFDGTLDYALGLELSNSHRVNVASRERIQDALRLMKKPLDTPIDADLGREVCLRDGKIRALLAGRVEKRGPDYLISAELIDPVRGTTMAGFQEKSSARPYESLAAIRRLSGHVRSVLGEAQPQEAPQIAKLEPVTTSNLRALQLYSRAEALMKDLGQSASAEELLRQAVAEDPSFASAWILLAFAILNQGKPTSEVVACAETAMSLSEATTDRERYFIRGSYYSMTNQPDKAIAAYEALLALYPDHFWAGGNLCHLYDWAHDPSARQRVAQIEASIADSRPRDFWWNSQADMTALFLLRDAARDAHYFQAASEAKTPELAQQFLDCASFVELHPFYVSWLSGDIGAASEALDRVAARIDHLDGELKDSVAASTALAYAGLGRLDAAARVSRKIGVTGFANATLAQVAFFRGDSAELRDRLGSKTNQDAAADWQDDTWRMLQIRAGLTSDSEQFLNSYEGSPRIELPGNLPLAVKTLRGEIALAHGRIDEARRQLEAGWEHEAQSVVVPPAFYLGRESLATILERQGDLARAIHILERHSDRSYTAQTLTTGFWLRNQLQLANLYRRVGRIEDARTVERELKGLLAFADATHPILVELNRSRA